MGGRIHDAIESTIKGENDITAIAEAIKNELADLEMLDLAFPKDRNGGDSIRDNWIANMTKFSQYFTIPKGKFETEQLVLFQPDGKHWMQGYIDAIRHNADGSLWIIDWKSSSNFDKNHLLEAGRQLILYAMAKEQEGYIVKKVSWCMMKYCVISWTMKNGKVKEKVSEWRNMVKSAANQIESYMTSAGYDDLDIEVYLSQAIEKNSFDYLPKDIADKFTVKIYVRDYEITPELRQECLDYIEESIKLYETLGDEENWRPCDCKKESFFCSNLCSFHNKCKYYQAYLEDFKREKDEDENLF